MNDNELAKGDEVRYTGALMTHNHVWTVIAVDGDWAWIRRTHTTGRWIDTVLPLSELKKVEPRFEVGKQYAIDGPPHTDRFVTVTDVNDSGAIGWWSTGAAWSRPHSLRRRWTEVQP